MRYVGGKSKIAKEIAQVIRDNTDATTLYEPFVGGGGTLEQLAPLFDRVEASDAHIDIVMMWDALKRGWQPPTDVSEQMYDVLRNSPPSALRGFVGAGGSFGGKWFGGYARGGTNADGTARNHQAESSRSLLRAVRVLGNVTFKHRGFEHAPVTPGDAVYCDPPYADTLGYASEFDTERFWRWAEDVSKVADVFVSEYRAPSGWEQVWSKEKRQSVTRPEQGRELRIERLFKYGG